MLNFTENDVVFAWFENHMYDGLKLFYGPYYTNWIDAINHNYYHTKEQILKLPLNKTIRKKIESAKEGTVVKMHGLHSNAVLCVKRLTEKEINELVRMENLLDAMEENRRKIRDLTKDLHEEQDQLDKQLKKTTHWIRQRGLK